MSDLVGNPEDRFSHVAAHLGIECTEIKSPWPQKPVCVIRDCSWLLVSSWKHVCEMKTPLIPILYSKTGVHKGTQFVLFFMQNIDCGYPSEPPGRGSSNMNTQSMIRAKVLKISNFFTMKFSIFSSEKNLYIFHGKVLVMCYVNFQLRPHQRSPESDSHCYQMEMCLSIHDVINWRGPGLDQPAL